MRHLQLVLSLAVALTAASASAEWSASISKSGIASIWANDGGDKVAREERRARDRAGRLTNSVWNGSEIKLFAARNEVVSFNLVIEADDVRGAKGVAVSFAKLAGPGKSVIQSVPESAADVADGVFNWVSRPIELFYVRYLKIKGLSSVSYDVYDERHVPDKMRLPKVDESGKGVGVWADRPFANKHVPEIAVPMELHPKFDILPASNQSVWVDVYVPRSAEAGVYRGTVRVMEAGRPTRAVPVKLVVRDFSLPDEPTSKTMLYMGYQDINDRYIGRAVPKPDSPGDALSLKVRNRHYQLAHRHKISVIEQAELGSKAWPFDRPRGEWMPRLDGTLYSPVHGYDGPGLYTGNDVFSIGTYSTWSWKREDDQDSMVAHTDAWEKWFQQYFPNVKRFLYLIDESNDFLQMERWAGWILGNPGPGGALPSFATLDLPHASERVPSLSISASTMAVGHTPDWQRAYADARAAGKEVWMYNGKRPASGSFATEDDGTALRELPWGQYKLGIDRWFFWESTYYADFQAGGTTTNVFQEARTIGAHSGDHPQFGEHGYLYSNGDGVLFYPGTDKAFPEESYGIAGPIASLRLKHWRRGIQDVDYLALAEKVDPVRTREIINRMVKKAAWENGVDDPSQPKFVHCDIGWSSDPDDWESARARLADIIEGK